MATDLDRDGRPDNFFAYATAALASTNDLTPHADDMIASGSLLSVVEIQADDLVTDSSVGLRYYGVEGDAATVVGGRIAAGAFTPNRVDSDHPGAAIVRLPVFVNADPIALSLDPFEIELTPDGNAGYEAVIRAAMPEQTAREAALAGLLQMFRTEPERHLVFLRGVDEDHDDTISFAELEASIIALLVTADVRLDDKDLVSVAFSAHLSPCGSGSCSTVLPANPCRDRAANNGESDIDCGGTCQPCADGLDCSVAADCQSNSCVVKPVASAPGNPLGSPNHCAAATCADLVRDGFESDVDCGGICAACGPGKACAADRDCASNSCSNGVASLGACS